MNGISKPKAQSFKLKTWLIRLFILSFAFWVLSFEISYAVELKLPSFPPLNFRLTTPERFTLENGLTFFLLPDHDLPLIQLQMMFKAGSQYDAPDKLGLSSVLASVWSQSGTPTLSSEEVERLLATTAASISFSIDLEQGTAGLSCRSGDWNTIFPVFVERLRHPVFPTDKLRLAKSQALEGLRRLNDDPGEISRREFRRLVYGGAHPYARVPSPQTIDHIKMADLQALHAAVVRPMHAYAAISGDFDPAEMKKRLKETFQDWPKTEAPFDPVQPVPPSQGDNRIYFIRRPLNQTQIRMGQLGFSRHSPEQEAWTVFNELWGAGSSSRLFTVVRTQKGLAYAVGSAYSALADRGLIVAISQTRGPETITAIQAIQEVNRSLVKTRFLAQDVQNAKEGLINEYAQRFTTAAQIVQAFMQHAYYGYPGDYLTTYIDRLRRVTPLDIQKAVQKYLKPDETFILLVGDPSTFEKPLSTLGKIQEVKPVDYTVSGN